MKNSYSYAVRINNTTLTGITTSKALAIKEAKERLVANFSAIRQVGH